MRYIPVFNDRGEVEFFIEPFSGRDVKIAVGRNVYKINPLKMRNRNHSSGEGLLDRIGITKGLNGEDITTFRVGNDGGDIIRHVETFNNEHWDVLESKFSDQIEEEDEYDSWADDDDDWDNDDDDEEW
ncbi:MAG: hypothetical protein FWD61_11525 [Phycisphaerales bacterium]|nr:hypothetical protein [Phycisphaerales bacterium]